MKNNKSSPYISLSGLAFKSGGTFHESLLNIKAAVDIVFEFITSGGSRCDVEEALDYLEENSLKAKSIIGELRIYLFIDEEFANDETKKRCGQLYNQLIKRLS